MKSLISIVFLASETAGQDGFNGVGLDFADFVEGGNTVGGLDGAAYDYSTYTIYEDGPEESRSRPSNEALEALRAAAEESSVVIDTTGYDFDPSYTGPNDLFEINNDYENYDYSSPNNSPSYGAYDSEFSVADFSNAAEVSSTVDDVFESVSADSSRRPIKFTEEKPAEKQLVGTHFTTTGFSCFVSHGHGSDTSSTVTDFQSGGEVVDCRTQGNGDFCSLEIRHQKGEVRQIISRCAQADECEGIRNFADTVSPYLPEMSRADKCRPTHHNGGNTYMQNKRFMFNESVCKTCIYTNDGTTDGSNDRGLEIVGSEIKIKNGSGGFVNAASVISWTREQWYGLATDSQSA